MRPASRTAASASSCRRGRSFLHRTEFSAPTSVVRRRGDRWCCRKCGGSLCGYGVSRLRGLAVEHHIAAGFNGNPLKAGADKSVCATLVPVCGTAHRETPQPRDTATALQPLRQFQRNREHAPQHSIAFRTLELAYDQFVEALVECACHRLHRDAAVNVGDEYAAIAVAGDAGDGAVFERDLDQGDATDVGRLVTTFEGVVDGAGRALHRAARIDVVANLDAQPGSIEERFDRLAEEFVVRAAGDDA